MRAIETLKRFETSDDDDDEEEDLDAEPRDLDDLLAHNADQLGLLADALQELARTHEQFLETGDLEEYVETMTELLDEPGDELCYPTREQKELLEKSHRLFGEFRAQVRKAQELLRYLEEEQERKRQARLRAYLQTHGYAKDANQEEPGSGWAWLVIGALAVFLASSCSP